MLTAKFVSRKISIPEMPPQSALSVSCLFSQLASAVHEASLYLPKLVQKRRTKSPSPQSSPASGARRLIADANTQKAVVVTDNLGERRHAYLPSLKVQVPNPNSQTNLKLENPKKDNYAIFKVTEFKMSVPSRA
jgi:hypothetical protein